MRKSFLAVVTAAALAGAAGGGALLAQAQPAPPPGAPAGPPPAPMAGPPAPPAPHPGWMHWMRDRDGRMSGWHRRPFAFGTFALFHPPADRQLTTADVQTIAQALLLWNGNHTWKVTDVAAGPDGQIGFTYSAPDNTVIARFSVDPHSGRLTRTG